MSCCSIYLQHFQEALDISPLHKRQLNTVLMSFRRML